MCEYRSLKLAATLRTENFLHIPGPNPILTVGGNGTWDSDVIECAGGEALRVDTAVSARVWSKALDQ